jgi:hypothetical protein
MTRGVYSRRPARCPHCAEVLQVATPARSSCDVYPTHPRGVPLAATCIGSLDIVERADYVTHAPAT